MTSTKLRLLGALAAAGAALLARNADTLSTIQSDAFWPPSRASAPFLSLLVAALAVLIAIVFCRPSASSATAELVSNDKRKLIMAQLSQAVKWDREDEEDEETDEKKKKEKEEAKAKEKKRPPESKDLFEMLYDDVEERHVTEHGIDAASAEYLGALALFKERLVPDIEEAARCTRFACEMAEPGDAEHSDDPTRVALFRDGARLKELVRPRGQSGAPGGAMSGRHQLLGLLLKAWGGHAHSPPQHPRRLRAVPL